MDDRNGFFEASVIRNDGRALVTVTGEIDMSTADRLRAALDDAMADGRPVEVDLSGTTFMDSTGLTLLLRAGGLLDGSRNDFVVRRPSSAVRRVLELSGADSALDIREDVPADEP